MEEKKPIEEARSEEARSTTTQEPSKFVYVKDQAVDAELICGICHDPLLDPVVEAACRQMFCRGCLETWHDKHKICPHCKVLLDMAKAALPPLFISNKVDGLRVICPRCSENFERKSLEAHLFKCPFPCKHGCGEKVAPADEEAHDDVCVTNVVPCPAVDVGCEYMCVRRLLSEHTATCKTFAMLPVLLRIQNLEEQVMGLRSLLSLMEIRKDLSGCNLRGEDLEDLHFENVNLSGANLTEADFTNVTFQNCNLTRARLTGAVFHDADLTGANLSEASAGGADFKGAKLPSSARLTHAFLRGAKGLTLPSDGTICKHCGRFVSKGELNAGAQCRVAHPHTPGEISPRPCYICQSQKRGPELTNNGPILVCQDCKASLCGSHLSEGCTRHAN